MTNKSVKIESKNVLFFGDSNTDSYFLSSLLKKSESKYLVERYAGLLLNENLFQEYLEIALKEDDWDFLILSIGTNDVGHGYRPSELEREYRKLREELSYLKVIIIGPSKSADINSKDYETTDGIHFTDKAKGLIGKRIQEILWK